jgi:hypothetical protein
MPDQKPGRVGLPPRWFTRLAWITHRRLHQWMVVGSHCGGRRQAAGHYAAYHHRAPNGPGPPRDRRLRRRRPGPCHHGHGRLGDAEAASNALLHVR